MEGSFDLIVYQNAGFFKGLYFINLVWHHEGHEEHEGKEKQRKIKGKGNAGKLPLAGCLFDSLY
jgi:hypothetical protein